MFKKAQETTRGLTRGRYSISEAQPKSLRWMIIVLAIVACGAYASWRFHWAVPDARLGAELALLTQQNKQLRDELEQLKLAASHDSATRSELQNQLDERVAQIKKLQDEISFFRNQRDRTVGQPVTPRRVE